MTNYSRVHLLDSKLAPDVFIASYLDNVSGIEQEWLANPSLWNMSYGVATDDLEAIFTEGNRNPTHWRSISCGDIIETMADFKCYLITPSGFTEIARPANACPHTATLTPDHCEFCAYGDD